MIGHRDGQELVICDGCFQPIVNFKPKKHNLKEEGRHTCSVQCARKWKKHQPTRPEVKHT